MSEALLGIAATGLVTSVGLSAPSTCAAIRAGLNHPGETRFFDSTGQWIVAHQVTLERPWRGLVKIAKMAAFALEECLVALPRGSWSSIPLLLCIAESDRPGRVAGLDEQLFHQIGDELGARFGPQSKIIPHGRVSASIALLHARQLLADPGVPCVAIAAADTFVTAPTLNTYEAQGRLLTAANPNGFMPGEGAGAVVVERAGTAAPLTCLGIGFGREPVTIHSEEPLRGDGLTQAIRNAVTEAGCELRDLDFRIADLSGEQYYFKEAALALGRLLRGRKPEFDLWHPAECIGETGAVAGIAMIAVAEAACRKAYAPGTRFVAHMANDDGRRAASVWHYSLNHHGQ